MYEKETFAVGVAGSNVPKPESEFDREARNLTNITESLSDRVSKLHEKLQLILHSESPKLAQDSTKEESPNTTLGQFLRQQRLKIEDTIRFIDDISARVGI